MTKRVTNVLTVSCTCWCERSEVMIPIEFLSEGRTLPCSWNGCAPGCPSTGTDDVVDEPDEAPVAARTGWQPWQDSHFTWQTGPHREQYPNHVILAYRDELCFCGCGETRKNPKGYFLQGHDERLKGKLVRAVKGRAEILLVEPVTGWVLESVDPLNYGERFTTAKMDWRAKLSERAGLTAKSEPVVQLSEVA